MATFTYTAKKDRGALFTGEAIGDSKAMVVSDLRRKGLTVVSLEQKKGALDFKQLLENSKRISVRDKAVFARQFATMISSGLAVLRALYILEVLHNSGHKAYLVGGCVRDLLLKGSPSEWERTAGRGLPGSGVTSPARGRRRHPTSGSVLQNAPSEGWLGWNIVLYKN